MTSLFFFTMTRLEGIPRSTPIIHALILAAGLITARIIARLVDESGKPSSDKTAVGGENIIMLGATQLTSLYVKLLGACAPGQRRILAILDDRPNRPVARWPASPSWPPRSRSSASSRNLPCTGCRPTASSSAASPMF